MASLHNPPAGYDLLLTGLLTVQVFAIVTVEVHCVLSILPSLSIFMVWTAVAIPVVGMFLDI